MTTAQRKWVLNQALKFIEEYKDEEALDDTKYEEMYQKSSRICNLSKNNVECIRLFNSIIACFDSKEQEKK